MISEPKTPAFLLPALLVIFLYQALGLPNAEKATQVLLVIWSILSLLFISRSETHFIFPQNAFRLSLAFITFSLLSLPFSVNISSSIESLIFTATLMWIFFFSQKYLVSHRQNILKSIIFLGIFLSLYSLLVYFLKSRGIESLIPKFSRQLVYGFYGHNNLAHIAGPAIIISLSWFLTQKKARFLALGLLLFIPFLLSFSRTAYLALIFTAILLFKTSAIRLTPKKIALLLSILLIPAILFFVTVYEARYFNSTNTVRAFLQDKLRLPGKGFLAGRNVYFQEAIASILDKPLTGSGADNYVYGSVKHSLIPDDYTFTSFNIVLDYLVEYGLIGGGLFLLFFFTLVKKSVKIPKPTPDSKLIALLVIYMTITFLFDSAFKIQSYFGLFLILCALNYKENYHVRVPLRNILFIQVIILFIAVQSLISEIALKNKQYEFAKIAYPVNINAHKMAIDQLVVSKNKKQADIKLKQLAFLYAEDPWITGYIAGRYEELGEKKASLYYYDKTFANIKYPSFTLIERIHSLKQQFATPQEVSQFEKEYVRRLEKALNFWKYTPTQMFLIKEFCNTTHNPCPHKVDEYLNLL